jgi:collagen type III alpha
VAGRDGRDGAPGLPGEKGLDGAPGVAGRDGVNGKDGTLDQLKVDYDGERTVRLCFRDGTPLEGGVITMPSQIDRGVFQAGKTYDAFDGVTWDGHFWIAQQETSEEPGEGNPAWRLAVRRGKQGREGKQGKDGSPGRDLTQMDPATGRKW